MQEATCIMVGVYESNLTRGKRYEISAIDAPNHQIRVRGNTNRFRWFPLSYFDLENRPVVSLQSFTIDDPRYMMEDGTTEVTVTLSTGELRWCLFMTPEALAKCGDWIPGTKIRFHYNLNHLVILNELRAELIEKVLHYIDSQNDLIGCTLPLATFQDEGIED